MELKEFVEKLHFKENEDGVLVCRHEDFAKVLNVDPAWVEHFLDANPQYVVHKRVYSLKPYHRMFCDIQMDPKSVTACVTAATHFTKIARELFRELTENIWRDPELKPIIRDTKMVLPGFYDAKGFIKGLFYHRDGRGIIDINALIADTSRLFELNTSDHVFKCHGIDACVTMKLALAMAVNRLPQRGSIKPSMCRFADLIASYGEKLIINTINGKENIYL